MVGRDQNPGQSARQVWPYLADLDMANMVTAALGGLKASRIRVLTALDIRIELGIVERMAEEAGAPFSEGFLRWYP